MEYLKGIFVLSFLSYISYTYYFVYFLIPMFIQLVFSYPIYKKYILKTATTIFLFESIPLIIARLIYDMVKFIHDFLKSSSLWDIITCENIIFDISYIFIFFIILIIINCLFYNEEIKKKNYKKLALLISTYLINILVILFMMIRFNLFIDKYF